MSGQIMPCILGRPRDSSDRERASCLDVCRRATRGVSVNPCNLNEPTVVVEVADVDTQDEVARGREGVENVGGVCLRPGDLTVREGACGAAQTFREWRQVRKGAEFGIEPLAPVLVGKLGADQGIPPVLDGEPTSIANPCQVAACPQNNRRLDPLGVAALTDQARDLLSAPWLGEVAQDALSKSPCHPCHEVTLQDCDAARGRPHRRQIRATGAALTAA
ncbi:MAG: hypothetical protein JJE50_10960 [Actinomycetales bacterium]|nr:hypothetical protein [Actinomycetales bacterium]